MFWKGVSLLVGSQWRAFCGLSQEQFVSIARTVLDDLGYQYRIEEVAVTQGEQTLLGADEDGRRFVVSSPTSFEVEVITATVDPVTNFAMSVTVTEEEQADIVSDLCVVTLRPVTTDSRREIARFMSDVIATSDSPPWQLTHHIKFRLAVLLRLKVRLLWKYWDHVSACTEEKP